MMDMTTMTFARWGSAALLLTGWAGLVGCGQTEGLEVPTSAESVDIRLMEAKLLDDVRVTEAVQAGYIQLNLGSGRDDGTVVQDARTLLVGALDGIEALDFEAGHRISLEYLGKGRAGGAPEDVDFDDADEKPADAPLRGVDAFNLATKNEFRLHMSGGLLEAIGRYDAETGRDRGTPTFNEEPKLAIDLPSRGPDAPPIIFSWSNGHDDRYRMYGVNAAVTNSVHRRIVQLGGGCSGTLVGPRHVVTAGHCLWSRTNQSWSDNFTVRAGRNGSSNATSVFVDADNIPNGQNVWYYTPAQYRSTTGSTWGFDYGILVVPARIGDVTGWMGRVSMTGTTLANQSIYRRGYPACVAFTSNGTPRIDEPSPCNANHLYGNSATCNLGEYQSVDSSGWSRVVHHSCDASGGDSGSPLYLYFNGSASVTAVHFSSRCATTAGSAPCQGSQVNRPLAALRLTPEYRDLIGSFRSIFP